jgi:drug/metabolite transporter (DMT)-like permease
MGSAVTAWLALAAVCFFWGTTYLGIRIAVETIPPEYLIAIRYTISGAILLIALKLGGMRFPGRREFLLTGLCGAICIGIGNGFLAFAETWVPSGSAALFYTTAPFWMIGIDALLPAGKRPLVRTVVGLVIGLGGVLLLIWPKAHAEGLHGATFTGFLVLQISAVGWCLGALLQKRVEVTSPAILSGAIQQFATGLVMFIPAALIEKFPHHVSARSYVAVGYLILFGSIVGYSSFIYSMVRLPVAIVSIYTFVNPVVAVILGYLFFRESFGSAQAMAMLVIFAGIAVVKWSESRRPATAARELGELETVGPET